MKDAEKQLLHSIPCFKQFATDGKECRLGFTDVLGGVVVISGENLKVEKVSKKRVNQPDTHCECGKKLEKGICSRCHPKR